MTNLETLLATHADITVAADRARDSGLADVASAVEAARPDLTLSALPPEAVTEAVGMWCDVAYAQRPGPYILSHVTPEGPTCVVFLPGAETKLTPHISTVTLRPGLPRAFRPDGSAVVPEGDTQ